MEEARHNILGIDPGASGGLVVLDWYGRVVDCRKMPPTMTEMYDTLKEWRDYYGIHDCALEDVGYGLPGQSSKATSTFSRHNGQLEMALYALGVSATKVLPQRWQGALGLRGKKGEAKAAHKARIKDWACRTFPSVKVTLWNADALAIAYWGVERRKGNIK